MKTSTFRAPGGALLPLAAALLALALPAAAAPRFVMELRDHDGNIAIAGESDAPGHPGAIEVVSFGKAYRPAEAGFPSTDTTGIECGIITDKALPDLLRAATRGAVIPKVDVYLLADDGQPLVERSAHMSLEHVQVVELTPGVGSVNPLGPAFAGGPMVAHLALNFSKVTWTYRNDATTEETSSTHVAYEPTEDPNFDDDKDGIPNHLDPDDDNDSVPDEHENGHGTNALVDDSAEDLDQDKQSNGDEWLAGTRADDPTSFFAVSSLSISQGGEGRTATVRFPIIADRSYRLLGTPNPALPRESWIEFDRFDTAPGTPDSEAEVILNPAVLPQLGRMVFTVEVGRRTP